MCNQPSRTYIRIGLVTCFLGKLLTYFVFFLTYFGFLGVRMRRVYIYRVLEKLVFSMRGYEWVIDTFVQAYQ